MYLSLQQFILSNLVLVLRCPWLALRAPRLVLRVLRRHSEARSVTGGCLILGYLAHPSVIPDRYSFGITLRLSPGNRARYETIVNGVISVFRHY